MKKEEYPHSAFFLWIVLALTLVWGSLPLFATSVVYSGYTLTQEKSLPPSIVAKKDFIPFDMLHRHLNFGFTSKHLWLKFELYNPSNKTVESCLVLDNPLLEEADLYCQGSPPQHQGLLQREYPHALNPAFFLSLKEHRHLQCLLHIHNEATTLQTGVSFQLPKHFQYNQQRREDFILFFLGMLFSLAILSFLMYLYAKDYSYLLYIFYLATLVFQQVTYTGFLPSVAPLWFNRLDNAAVVPKIALMIIAAALYARAFLGTSRWRKIDTAYKFFIWFTLLQIPLVGTPYFYFPEATVITGLIFVLFNTYAGITVYKEGCKSARFFILAWLILAPGYIGMILDALGVMSVMYKFPMLIMVMTTIEAILLLLAFVDRFYHYQIEKLAYERRYNQLLTNQKEEVENRVTIRTAELKNALDETETLFQELHHRVKNNLQLILSIVRLQRNRAKQNETKEALQTFEQRIATIAHTHEMLQHEKGHEWVQMHSYIHNLCSDLMHALSKEQFTYECDSDVELPLREAVYVGLVINELITNLVKHNNVHNDAAIKIILQQQKNNYILQIEAPNDKQPHHDNNGLGLLIVRTLVEKQLGGSMHLDNDENITTIRFAL